MEIKGTLTFPQADMDANRGERLVWMYMDPAFLQRLS
jgi:hypothetical protein